MLCGISYDILHWTVQHPFNFSNHRAKQVGPVLKILLSPCIFILLILWPVVGILASILGGALYGFLSPMFATFDAVGEGKTNEFYHCLYVCDPIVPTVPLWGGWKLKISTKDIIISS